jgi:hypothetical protein
MTTRETVRLLTIPCTRLQLYACEYLEQQGLKFCVHFGLDNAIEKASNYFLKP